MSVKIITHWLSHTFSIQHEYIVWFHNVIYRQYTVLQMYTTEICISRLLFSFVHVTHVHIVITAVISHLQPVRPAGSVSACDQTKVKLKRIKGTCGLCWRDSDWDWQQSHWVIGTIDSQSSALAQTNTQWRLTKLENNWPRLVKREQEQSLTLNYPSWHLRWCNICLSSYSMYGNCLLLSWMRPCNSFTFT